MRQLQNSFACREGRSACLMALPTEAVLDVTDWIILNNVLK
jgi:hypothetical protein